MNRRRPDMVGRDAELATLLKVVTGPPSLAFVAGEAGIGKTRLVHTLIAGLPQSRRWVAVGSCQPGPEPFPYGPVLDCLRRCGPRLIGAELNPVVGAVRPYLPEIAHLLPAAPEPLGEPSAERHRFFRGVRELLCALGTCVLIMENLHWADEGTRHLLRFLLAEPPDGLALVLTYRPEDLTDGGPLGLAATPDGASTVARLSLSPLDRRELHALALDILPGVALAATFVTALHERSGGIPYVAEEILHALESAAPTPAHIDAVDVPAGVLDTTASRLAALSEDAVALVLAAAVTDAPASATLLSQVAGLDSARTRVALVESLRGNMLVPAGTGSYGFRHVLARRAAYQRLTGPESEELHVRAMQALRKEHPLPYAQLAEHARCAGRLVDWVSYGEAAADAAYSAGDTDTATALLRRLLNEPALGPSDVDRIAVKFARAARAGLDQREATALLSKLMADPRLSAEIRGEIRLSLGLLLVREERGLEAGWMEIELAVNELRGRPELAARGMNVLAEPYIGTRPIAENLRWMSRAEQVLADATDPQLRVTLLANAVANRVHIGDHDGWELAKQLPERVVSAAEHRELARAHCNLADACSWTGHYDLARTHLSIGLRLAADCDAGYIMSVGLTTELRLDWYAGTWAHLTGKAAAYLNSYSELLPVTTELELVLAWLSVARGEWETALAHFDNTGVRNPANAITPVALSAHAGMIRMHLSREDTDAAVAEAGTGLELLRAKGVWSWAGELVPAAVTALCQAGLTGQAEDLLAELRAQIDGRDAPGAAAAVNACLGDIAAARSALAEAIDHYASAQRACARLPAPYQVALLAEKEALCRLRLEQPDATDALTELAETFDGLGATRDAARCRHVLRDNGSAAQSRRGRRGYGNELSPRERDVARLLAGNRTNREIAEVLFLSKRTVEQHVASVLRKLRVTSRHDLVEPD
ncbi:ATP-binding protein [Nonomuraea sp. NPDC050556]|uniref:ATP-binding protein n=1 Tax=Nonomuraea sp. NPDC050556 TaxID=3364369 RepID=UPI0037A243D8